MPTDRAHSHDPHASRSGTRRGGGDTARLVGWVEWELRDRDGHVKASGWGRNLVTDRGDEYAALLFAGQAETLITGMRLGTDGTAPAKSGTGAAIVTYVAGSAKALDTGYPDTSDKGAGSGHRATYQITWASGEATQSDPTIKEVVLTNEDPISDVAGAEGDTIARFLLDPEVAKGSDDTLEVTWHYDVLGA